MKITEIAKLNSSLRNSIVIAGKDLKSMLRERTFMSVILLLIFVASFTSVLTFGLLILYNPTYMSIIFQEDIKVGVSGSAPVLESVFNAKHYDSLNTAIEDFYRGEIDVILWLPYEDISGENFVQVFLPRDEVKSIQASIFVKNKLIEYQNYLRKLRGIPEGGEIRVFVSNKEISVPEGVSMVFKFIYVVIIPLMMITTAVIASGLFIDLVTEEIETGTIVPLFTAISKEEIVNGKIIASVTLPVVLTPLWLVLLMLNGVEISNFLLVMAISYAFSFIMISTSALIVSVFKDRERSQLVFSVITVGIMPLLSLIHI